MRARRTRAPSGNSPCAHPGEEVEVLLHGSVAPRARPARLGQRPAMLSDLVGGQVVDVGQPGTDQMPRPFVELLEVVRGVMEVLAPVEAEPAHVGLDRVDVLLLLLRRVRVVEAQVATPAELGGDPEVQADRLRVADVEIAVGLRREARDDRVPRTRAQVLGHDVADEVAGLRPGRLDAHAWRLPIGLSDPRRHDVDRRRDR